MASEATSLWGPTFVGLMFNVLLYGITITQVSVYFTQYGRDRLWMKIFVFLVFIADTTQSAFDVAYAFDRLVVNYGNFDALALSTPVFAAHPVLIAIVALFVQMFFAWRIKILTSSWPLVLLIAICSLTQFCGGLGTTIGATIIPELPEFQKFQVIVIVWLAFSAITDTLIAVSLVWHLRKQRTGFSATDDVIDRIIRLTVQTGAVTALFAIVDMICFLVSSSSLHLTFNFILPKLYVNSLFSSLNSRPRTASGPGAQGIPNNQWNASQGRVGGRLDAHVMSAMQPSAVYDGRNTVHQVVIGVDSNETREDFDRKGDKASREYRAPV